MPVFEIEMNGETYEVDAPSQEIAVLSLKSSMPTQDEKDTAPTGSFGQGVVDAVEGLGKGLYNTVRHPIDTAIGMGKAQIGEGGKALDNFKQGRYSEAVGHGAATLLPLLGPMAASAGEDIGTGDPRKVGQGVTNASMLLAPMGVKAGVKAAPKAIGAVARSTPDWAVPVAGATVGGLMDGPRGFMEGAVGGSALERAMPRLRKLGLPKEDAAPTKPSMETPKSEKAIPMTREQAYEQERFDQRMDDTHGADNPVPGNSGPRSLDDHYKQLTRSAVLSPEDAATLEHLDKVMKQRASREGMRHASGKEPVRKRAVQK